jgi:hypothetical protein
MSRLREIMQKLGQAQLGLPSEPQPAVEGHGELLRLHVENYQRQLDACTAAMLQYEWVWLEEHIASLELCISSPEMLKAAGGKLHVEQLLLASQQCQSALQTTMESRAVQPSPHPHAVAAGEHAWEIRQETIKRMWGLDQS